MTIEEFDKTGFGCGYRCIYKKGNYLIQMVDFEEKLFGIDLEISGDEPNSISWVRCENVEFIKI